VQNWLHFLNKSVMLAHSWTAFSCFEIWHTIEVKVKRADIYLSLTFFASKLFDLSFNVVLSQISLHRVFIRTLSAAARHQRLTASARLEDPVAAAAEAAPASSRQVHNHQLQQVLMVAPYMLEKHLYTHRITISSG